MPKPGEAFERVSPDTSPYQEPALAVAPQGNLLTSGGLDIAAEETADGSAVDLAIPSWTWEEVFPAQPFERTDFDDIFPGDASMNSMRDLSRDDRLPGQAGDDTL